jgi:hypothetical protein
LSEVLRSEFQFYFQKILRQAGIAKGMATDPLCSKKRKNIKIMEKIFISQNNL